MIAELDARFILSSVLPELLNRYLADSGHLDYDIDVIAMGVGTGIPNPIYSSVPAHTAIDPANADGRISLLSIRNGGPPPEFRSGSPSVAGSLNRGFGLPPNTEGTGPWTLLVRHRAGSLEALVNRTRQRNLAISGAVLLLILSTVAILVRLSRQAQRLAELRIGFVAGVSHELKTPLTVIRTCAYNLRNPAFRSRTDQVERYGLLIEAESAKLEALVDQVLRFASAEAGHAVRERKAVSIADVISEELELRRSAFEGTHVAVELDIAAGLPSVIADEAALRHAFQNLLENALKYGTSMNASNNWIGVFAHVTGHATDRFVEIRVADRGPGIPADEQGRIFEAFYRGTGALRDQVRGTGLGLNLTRTVIEAHGGTIRVSSEPGKETEFIVRLPAEEQ